MLMKNKKKYYAGLILLVLAALSIYFYQKANRAVAPERSIEKPAAEEQDQGLLASSTPGPAPAEQATGTSPAQSPAKTAQAPAPQKATYSDGSEMEPFGPDIQVFEVVYDGAKFSPASLSIKAGDVVIFKNSSQVNFWPASDPHPTHTDYPEFDAKKPIPPGGTFQFKFMQLGTWGYHNHLQAAATGVVKVSK